MLKKLKGQVSIFIIIGIILVIVTSFLFFNSKFELFVPHDTKLKNQISQIVDDCIYDSADNGVFLLGFQGGYIDIAPEIEANPFSHIDLGFKIPNWDTKSDRYPTISSMQVELENFILEDGLGCIETNLRSLSNFEIDINGDFEVESRINEQNVVIEASLPITFNEVNSEEVLTVDDYVVKLEDTRLGDLYNLAIQIYNLEQKTNMFEVLTIDQIQSANDYSSPESMPSEGMALSCSKKIWTIPQLKKNLASMNNNNFKYLQILGTYSKDDLFERNLGDAADSYREYFEKQYVYSLDNSKSSFKNYDVEVFMPSTEITGEGSYIKRYPYRQFDVTPSNGQIVKSLDMEIDMGPKIPIPCIQVIHHLYDLDYDLMVKLTDMNENGEKYMFQFPIRVEVKKNTPKIEPYNFIPAETKTFNKESYCNDESKQYPLMVVANDNYGNELNDVNISYKCISVKCDIGQVSKPYYDFAPDVERSYAQPQLVADFPYCFGGSVIGEKEGYHVAKKRVNTDEGLLRRESFFGDNLVELELIGLKSFYVDESSFLVISKETGYSLPRIRTDGDGMVVVSIENKNEDFESTVMWPNEPGYLDRLDFLDENNVLYNLSVVYMNADSELRGIIELENWKPEIYNGNNIQFKIPGSNYNIEEGNYVEFYEYAKDQVLTNPDYGIRIN